MDFDPVAIEAEMVRSGVLPERGDSPIGPLGELEKLFTEFDERKYALWRISMVRQLQPAVLKQLSPGELSFLAGQTPGGYPDPQWGQPGIQLDKNKVQQNAIR